jgi:putative lipoprotein
MRPPFPIPTAAALAVALSCSSAVAQSPAVVGEWAVLAIGEEAVAADDGLTVTFAADGGLSGSTGCNTFSGRYETRGAGVTVGPLRMTRRGCPEAVMRREAAMMRVLGTARRVDPRVEGRVALLDAAGAAILLAPRVR